MFDIFVYELLENGPVNRESLNRLPLKYLDLNLCCSEVSKCLTHSKDVKYYLMNSTAHILQVRTLGVESHCHLPHKLCLIKYIQGSVEGQHTVPP